MKTNYLDIKDIEFKTFFGRVVIKTTDKTRKLSPPRIEDRGAKLKETTRQIVNIKVKDIDLLKKLNLPNLSFMLIVNRMNTGNSYTPNTNTLREFIYIVPPRTDDEKLCFLNSILHEVGHAMLHPYNTKRHLKKELEAWLFSIRKSEELFGQIKKENYKVLEKHIVGCLKSHFTD